jgi:homoserine dehydrogenase
MAKPLKVGLAGLGTVGSAVVRLLQRGRDKLMARCGRSIEVVAISGRSRNKKRSFDVGQLRWISDPATLARDPDIDVLVEVIGGASGAAKSAVGAALAAGKPVVTANKHVLARHGPELEEIARRTGAALRFEASVGGGIPILGPLATNLAADHVVAVRGIVNGTTNYILSAMTDEGRDYATVLADAQAAGYAEADPSGDVEGHDAVNKLVILARLSFGAWLPTEDVVTIAMDGPGAGSPGITGVTARDIAAAAAAGSVVKLSASATRDGGNEGDADDRIAASVLPTLVPADSAFGRTSGVLNRIEIEAEPVGTVAFAGPGAGGAATSSAVLGDLIAIARGLGSTWAGLPPAGIGVSARGDASPARATVPS